MFKRIVSRIVLHLIAWGSTSHQSSPNLAGDRDVEYAWVASHIEAGPGKALDFGCGTSHLGLVATHRGYDVTALDLQEVSWAYVHPRLKFVRADILTLDWAPSQYDLIINCSAIEHVGLSGRYGSNEIADGDLCAMVRLRELLKPNGSMILTIPVGRDAVIAPYHRIYGPERLPRLLDSFQVKTEEYYTKSDTDNRWRTTSQAQAFNVIPSKSIYALGLYVLSRV